MSKCAQLLTLGLLISMITTTARAEEVRLSVGAPIPSLLLKGVAVIPIKTENMLLSPDYGAAAALMPRRGHLHVTLDGASWHWVHADTGPVVIQGLPVGSHQVLVELADANHQVIASQAIAFEQPAAEAKH